MVRRGGCRIEGKKVAERDNGEVEDFEEVAHPGYQWNQCIYRITKGRIGRPALFQLTGVE